MLPHNKLYSDHADLYSLIADDRDFTAEIERMGAMELGRDARFIELFAGPAYHSRALVRSGWRGETYAIDVSSEMASVARSGGYTGRYVCVDAIESLGGIDSADIICIPRFSIVLVDELYVRRLFGAVRRVMRESSRFFVEVHPDLAQETDWRSLAIRERRARRGAVEVICEWPHAVCEVPGVSGAVDMTIRVSVADGSGSSAEHFFVSREHLHPKADLIRWAKEEWMTWDPGKSFLTSSGEFLAFAAAPPAADYPHGLANLLQASLTSRFDLRTEEARESAIRLSGLDMSKHDSPLSCHVYNLL